MCKRQTKILQNFHMDAWKLTQRNEENFVSWPRTAAATDYFIHKVALKTAAPFPQLFGCFQQSQTQV